MREASMIRAGSQGFTLIELLVSLALLGMAAALLLQGLATAGIVAQRERTRAIGIDEVVSAQRVLRREIERLRPLTQLNSAIPILELDGTDAALAFIGPPFDRAAPDALQRFRLIRTASGDLVLYNAGMRKDRVNIFGGDLVGWTPNPLLHGVRDLSMRYFGPSAPGRARGWQRIWRSRSAPPELIRIRVGFDDGDRRIWPDLLIRPHATKFGVCRFDAMAGKCVEDQ